MNCAKKTNGSQSPEKTKDVIYASELLDRRWLSKTAFELEFARPDSFDFEPGQCICFIHETIERYYSLISAPDDPTIRLCIHFIEEGVFTPLLSTASIGTCFNFVGPRGYFTFRPSERPPVFIATGVGIAPFCSMGRSGITGFALLHEAEEFNEFYYASFFQSCAKQYVPCLLKADSDPKDSFDTFNGKAVEYLEKYLPPVPYDFYLCGQREMIREVTFLVDDRFPGSFIFREVFH